MMPFSVELTFHGDLSFFLKSKKRRIERRLSERTSVKDVIEACGIPHTEVDLILVEGDPVDFARVVTTESKIDIYPFTSNRHTLFPKDRLQVLQIRKFVADGHLGKLIRDLRLLGIDVAYDPTAEDRQLVAAVLDQQRALLTRDRRLLMHAAVRHGYYLRSQYPLEQTLEVLRRFDLRPAISPFSRCLRCNALLEPVPKERVIDQLQPLTRIHYQNFRRCSACGQVYWSGSHFEKLQKRIETIQSRLARDPAA
jgi:uncharacterized protein with PIN domain